LHDLLIADVECEFYLDRVALAPNPRFDENNSDCVKDLADRVYMMYYKPLLQEQIKDWREYRSLLKAGRRVSQSVLEPSDESDKYRLTYLDLIIGVMCYEAARPLSEELKNRLFDEIHLIRSESDGYPDYIGDDGYPHHPHDLGPFSESEHNAHIAFLQDVLANETKIREAKDAREAAKVADRIIRRKQVAASADHIVRRKRKLFGPLHGRKRRQKS
jgi:hypothetical protein